MPRKVEISHKTIIFVVAFLGGLWLLFYIRDILFQFFIAVFIMVVLNPTVRKLSKFKIPRAVSVLIVYLSALALISISIGSIVPPLIEETTNFASNLPTYLRELNIAPFIIDQLNAEILSQVGALPAQVLRVGVAFFSNIIEIVTILIFAFYLLMSRDKIDKQIEHFVGKERGDKVAAYIDELEIQLGGWARGQLSLMLLIGFTTYIGLLLLGIPYAIPLAIIAGLLEAVPYVGPIMAAIPAIIIGFGISPILGLASIALAFLIQQVESYVFVPKVMEKSAGVSPIITLLSLAIGFRLAGIAGILMSVAVVIAIRVLSKEFLHK